jgi:hypothetical protein
MRQFMGNQPPPLLGPRRELAYTEYYVMAHRVSIGVHIPRRLLGHRLAMHTHMRKVVAQALLHVLAQFCVQRPANAGKSLVYTGWCRIDLPG